MAKTKISFSEFLWLAGVGSAVGIGDAYLIAWILHLPHTWWVWPTAVWLFGVFVFCTIMIGATLFAAVNDGVEGI